MTNVNSTGILWLDEQGNPDKKIAAKAVVILDENGNISGSNLNEDTLEEISSKLPTLVNGRIPVQVESLNVSLSQTTLEITNDVGNPIPVSFTNGGSVTPSFISTTASGTISAGKISISFSNIGSVSGILLGSNLPAGASISYAAPLGKTLGSFVYNATGTTFLIGATE